MKSHQELQDLIVYLGKNDWGYLTPGWGPSQAVEVDTKALIAAYQGASYTSGIWIHSHFDNTLGFSATDFALVWTRNPPSKGQTGPITYLINSHMELRVLTDAYLHKKFNELDFGEKRNGLYGLQKAYWQEGLPGLKP